MSAPLPSRRTVLKTAAAAAAAIAAPTFVRAQEKPRLRVALIGCGGRGRGLAGEFAAVPGVELAWCCDPDASRADAAAKERGGMAKTTPDLRRALEDKTVEAVIVATADHWHVPAALLALEAGKHVYVEKPCSHNVREGRLLVDAARRTGLCVQHGTQTRSNPQAIHAMRLLREGIIGDVRVAKAWNVQRRGSIGRGTPTDPPAGVDYDLWVGPAPFVPYQANRFHYHWHWWHAFGTGDTGNDGVHELDIARWGLGVDVHPAQAAALGGKLEFDDDQEFPDTQFATFLYPAADGGKPRQLSFEMRLWSRYGLDGTDNGNAFYGPGGWMLYGKRGILKVFDEQNREQPLPAAEGGGSSHAANFVAAIRGEEKLRAEIAEGHLSATLCHLANIAARTGRSLRFDPAAETLADDAESAALLGRTYRDGHWAAPRA